MLNDNLVLNRLVLLQLLFCSWFWYQLIDSENHYQINVFVCNAIQNDLVRQLDIDSQS